jgi:hypothetical protein
MPGIAQDFYGHVTPSSNGPNGANFTGAATGTAAGTVVADGTRVTAAPANINANDTAGQFTVTIAGGEGSTHGNVAQLYYQEPLAAAPKAIIATALDQTTNTVMSVNASPLTNATQGIQFALTATGTAADVVLIQYHVIL